MPAIFRPDFTGTPDYMNWNAGMMKGDALKRPDLRKPEGFSWVDASGNEVAGPSAGGQARTFQGGNWFSNPAGGGGMSIGGGAAGGGMGGSGSMWGIGGGDPFATDAAAAKLRGEYERLRKRSSSAINEDLAARGIFSSGVGADLMGQRMGELNLSEAAGLEDLFNNAAQQRMAWEMEQQRARSSGGGEGFRYGSANDNQAMMDAMGMGGPTGARFGNSSRVAGAGGYPQQGGAAAGGGGMKVGDAAWKAEQARYKALDLWRQGLGPHPDTGEWKVGNKATGQSQDYGFGGWANPGF